MNPIPEITVSELKAALKSGKPNYLVVDVREADERAEAKIDSSIHVPLGDILENKAAPLPKDRPVVLQCRSGKRSLRAAEHLATQLGHHNVFNLTGGILAWQELQK